MMKQLIAMSTLKKGFLLLYLSMFLYLNNQQKRKGV